MESNEDFDYEIEDFSDNEESEIDYGNFEDDNLDEPLYTNKDDLIEKEELDYESKHDINSDDEEASDNEDQDTEEEDIVSENEEDEDTSETYIDDLVNNNEKKILIKKKINKNNDSNFNNELYQKIQNYKKENMTYSSELEMISLMCELIQFIKRGGRMIDNRVEFDYPNEVEESYMLESIILNTYPFVNIVNKYEITKSYESILICLKKVLRGVDDDRKYFFTPVFCAKFPLFIKNLYKDSISKEEYKEINDHKNKLFT